MASCNYFCYLLSLLCQELQMQSVLVFWGCFFNCVHVISYCSIISWGLRCPCAQVVQSVDVCT